MDVQIRDKDDVMFIYDVKVLDQEKSGENEYKITVSNGLCKIILKVNYPLKFNSNCVVIVNPEHINYLELYDTLSELITILGETSDKICDLRFSLDEDIAQRLDGIRLSNEGVADGLEEIKYAIRSSNG